MLERVAIELYGTVQGVFLRRSIAREAKHRGVSGFVANRDDGSVLVEAEAQEEVLNNFIAWVKQGAGSGLHRIDLVEVTSKNPFGIEGFEVQD